MGEGSLWAAAHCGPPGSDGQVQVLLTSCHIAVATEAAGEVRGGDVQEARREACQDSSSSLPNLCDSPASLGFLNRAGFACVHAYAQMCAVSLGKHAESIFSIPGRVMRFPPYFTVPLLYNMQRAAEEGSMQLCAKVYRMFHNKGKKNPRIH